MAVAGKKKAESGKNKKTNPVMECLSGVLTDSSPYIPSTETVNEESPERKSRAVERFLLPIALFFAVFGVYLFMLCPTVPAGDSGELITAAASGGIAHPPGYPLYTMLGRLFTFIPHGSIAWRVNLMSAVFNAAAVVVVYFVLWHIMYSAMPALIGALFLAFSTIFWRYSLVAEVFALNDFLVAVLVLILIVWSRQLPPASSSEKRLPRPPGLPLAYLWCLVLGLSLSNHHTVLFVVPAFGYFLWRSSPSLFRPQFLIPGFICFLLGLLPYLYLPLASGSQPYLNWDNPAEPAGFLRLITRGDYGTITLSPASASRHAAVAQVPLYLISLINEFTLPGFIFGLLGMYRLYRRNRCLFNFFFSAWLLSGMVFLIVGNLNIEKASFHAVISRFHLMPGIFFTFFIAFGIELCASLLFSACKTVNISRIMNPAVSLLFSVSVAASFLLHFNAADQRGNTLAYQFGMNVLRTLPPNALLMATGDTFISVIDYLHVVEKQRPDIKIIEEKVKFPWYVKQLRRRYPDIQIPFPFVDLKEHFYREVIDANSSRFAIYLHYSSDPTIAEKYSLVPYGLVYLVLPIKTIPENEIYKKDLNRILDQYIIDADRLGKVRNIDFEGEIVLYYAAMYDSSATFLFKNNDYQSAEEYWRKAIAVWPSYAPPYKNLGVVYAYHSKTPDARTKAAGCWRKFLELSPNNPEKARIEEEIKRLLNEK